MSSVVHNPPVYTCRRCYDAKEVYRAKGNEPRYAHLCFPCAEALHVPEEIARLYEYVGPTVIVGETR